MKKYILPILMFAQAAFAASENNQTQKRNYALYVGTGVGSVFSTWEHFKNNGFATVFAKITTQNKNHNAFFKVEKIIDFHNPSSITSTGNGIVGFQYKVHGFEKLALELGIPAIGTFSAAIDFAINEKLHLALTWVPILSKPSDTWYYSQMVSATVSMQTY